MSLMTSVERILQYTNLPKEEPITSDNSPPPTWPSQEQLILKDNLNVSIEPGWKIGIGRTGAGKSSLISALFRLFCLVKVSLRYNLDPFNQYDDLKLWKVLRQIELNDVTLDHDIFSGDHNFSVRGNSYAWPEPS
ncbi:ABCC8 protein, partial [Acromyrmex heyeri]